MTIHTLEKQQPHVSEENINDIQERVRLLQIERKDCVEATEANKATNREIIQHLHDKNKNLRLKLLQLQRAGKDGGDETENIQSLESEISRLRKVIDINRTKSSTLSRQLQSLTDTANDIHLESSNPGVQNPSMCKKFNLLETKLADTMVKYNEAKCIRETYIKILHRMREERTGFDNILGALEKAVHAKNEEVNDLMELNGEANLAKEVSLAEVEKARIFYQNNQFLRKKESNEKDQIANDRMKISDIINAETQNKELNSSVHLNSVNAITEENADESNNIKLDTYKEVFEKIRETTGVCSVNEIIKKLLDQDTLTNSLKSMLIQNKSTIQSLQEKLDELRSEDGKKKNSNYDFVNLSQQFESFEKQIYECTTSLLQTQIQHEVILNTSVDAKAGIEHLNRKLMAIYGKFGKLFPVYPLDKKDPSKILLHVACCLKAAQDVVNGGYLKNNVQGNNVNTVCSSLNVNSRLENESELDEDTELDLREEIRKKVKRDATVAALNGDKVKHINLKK